MGLEYWETEEAYAIYRVRNEEFLEVLSQEDMARAVL